MPSGEPAPAPTRHDRNLEALGGSSRLELGLGGVARVMRRRGPAAHPHRRRSRSPRSTRGAPCCRSATRRVAWVKITDQSQNLFDKAGSSVDVTKEQKAVVLTLESPRLSEALVKALGPEVQGREVGARHRPRGVTADPRRHVGDVAADRASRPPRPRRTFAVGDRQVKVQKKLAADAAKLDQTIDDPNTGLVAKLNAVSGAARPAAGDLRARPGAGRGADGAEPGVDRHAAPRPSRRTTTR